MKFFLFFVMVTVVVALVQAQCPARPATPRCVGARDEGTARGPTGPRECTRRAGRAWWFNARTRRCERINYRGCGGNNNRHCTLEDCNRLCQRRN